MLLETLSSMLVELLWIWNFSWYPHMVSAGLKNMAALCADIDFTFEEIQPLKDFLADPEAFASAAAAAAPAAGGGAAAAEAAPAAAPVQEEEEEEDMDFDLFG